MTDYLQVLTIEKFKSFDELNHVIMTYSAKKPDDYDSSVPSGTLHGRRLYGGRLEGRRLESGRLESRRLEGRRLEGRRLEGRRLHGKRI